MEWTPGDMIQASELDTSYIIRRRQSGVTISEASRKYGLTPDTLRYYERIGLIPPVPRTKSGIRDYGEESCGWIELMKCMRAAGVQIEALAEYVALYQQGEATLGARRALLAAGAAGRADGGDAALPGPAGRKNPPVRPGAGGQRPPIPRRSPLLTQAGNSGSSVPFGSGHWGPFVHIFSMGTTIYQNFFSVCPCILSFAMLLLAHPHNFDVGRVE